MQKFSVYRSFLMKHEFHVTNVQEMTLHLRLNIRIFLCKQQPINAVNRYNDFYCELCKGKLNVSQNAEIQSARVCVICCNYCV